MRIGVDLDNTILDGTSSHLHYYNLASGLSLTADDVNDFYIYRLYGWSPEERDEVFRQYGHDIHWNSQPYPMAIEALGQLIQDHQVSFITARPEKFRTVTTDWLKLYKFMYHNITFTENKLQACTDLKIDVLIDDAPHYAEEFAYQNKPVILYDQPYNRHIANNMVYRATDWNEVKKHLKNLPINL
ncbi:5' nucleotidase, NT5C type [Paenibacillus sp. Soil787]|uniref:5' nucleotidase, NT5C type n=1 Tax=Paenibacillus sp. Soil787 TaxID=1736411 RepID=UPI000702DCAD|nr:hypothetical protein [Paenibacillus sp. Soil787]KRF13676.1 hypothetical protein ASG93_14300 [Paenibacillus sp. Soil787]